MEKIDVLLATYNGEKYLKEQLDSILLQTYSDLNIIISDDCSTDKTRDILKQYANKDKRIKLFFQEKNLGYVKNFEFLLTKIENEIYVLSDQDDVWNHDKVEKTYNKLKETNADLVFTDLEVVDDKLNTIYPSFNDYMNLSRKIKKYKNSYKLQYLYNCVTGCTLMAKKRFMEYILPLPVVSKYVIHDTWIATVVANKGKIEYLDEKTIKYRQHGNNQIGAEKTTHNYTSFDEIRKKFIDVKLGLFNTYTEKNEIFNEKIKNQNIEALEYFEMIKHKKNVNFKKWNVFFKIYKTETLRYFILNFGIMNIPKLSGFLFKIKSKEKI